MAGLVALAEYFFFDQEEEMDREIERGLKLEMELELELEHEPDLIECEEGLDHPTIKDMELELMEWELEWIKQEEEVERENAEFCTEMEIDEFDFSVLMEEFERLEKASKKLARQTERRELARLKRKNRRAVRREQKARAQKRIESICLQNRHFCPVIKEDGWRFTHGLQKYNFMGCELKHNGVIRIPEEKPGKRCFFADIDPIDGCIFGIPVGVWNARKAISKITRASRGDDDLGFKSSGRRPRAAARDAIRQGLNDMEDDFRELQKELEALAFWDGEY